MFLSNRAHPALSTANGVVGPGALRLPCRIVLRLPSSKPEKTRGCCGVAVPEGEQRGKSRAWAVPIAGLPHVSNSV